MDNIDHEEPDYKKIGERLREIRGPLSRKAFGDSVGGYSYAYVRDCEAGKKPSIEYLLKISNTYNISLDWLIKGIVPIDTTTQKVEAVFDPDLKMMIDVLKSLMESGDPDLRGWAKIQFKTAFKEHCATLDEKKLHA